MDSPNSTENATFNDFCSLKINQTPEYHPSQQHKSPKYVAAFKSSRIDRNYELNALERHHNVVNTSGELGIFFKPRSVRVGGVSVRNVHSTSVDGKF